MGTGDGDGFGGGGGGLGGIVKAISYRPFPCLLAAEVGALKAHRSQLDQSFLAEVVEMGFAWASVGGGVAEGGLQTAKTQNAIMPIVNKPIDAQLR
jgi:hypothetical protein